MIRNWQPLPSSTYHSENIKRLNKKDESWNMQDIALQQAWDYFWQLETTSVTRQIVSTWMHATLEYAQQQGYLSETLGQREPGYFPECNFDEPIEGAAAGTITRDEFCARIQESVFSADHKDINSLITLFHMIMINIMTDEKHQPWSGACKIVDHPHADNEWDKMQFLAIASCTPCVTEGRVATKHESDSNQVILRDLQATWLHYDFTSKIAAEIAALRTKRVRNVSHPPLIDQQK